MRPSGVWAHNLHVKKLLAKADKELAEVNRLLVQLRKRIANAAEDVQLAAKKAATRDGRPGKKAPRKRP
jgi:hypothetical protein